MTKDAAHSGDKVLSGGAVVDAHLADPWKLGLTSAAPASLLRELHGVGALKIVNPPRKTGNCGVDAVAVLGASVDAARVALRIARALEPSQSRRHARVRCTAYECLRELRQSLLALSDAPLAASDGASRAIALRMSVVPLSRMLRQLAFRALQDRRTTSTPDADASDAVTDGCSVRFVVLDALLDALGLRALLIVHDRRSDAVHMRVIGRRDAPPVGALLCVSEGNRQHFHAVLADEHKLACIIAAVDTQAAVASAPEVGRLKSAADAERHLWTSAESAATRETALDTLATVSAFDPQKLVWCLRGGGGVCGKPKSPISVDMIADPGAISLETSGAPGSALPAQDTPGTHPSKGVERVAVVRSCVALSRYVIRMQVPPRPSSMPTRAAPRHPPNWATCRRSLGPPTSPSKERSPGPTTPARRLHR